jgi:two-component system sensor histidine kinase/response regulator
MASNWGKHFRVILLDAQMPETDGFTLAKQIKENPEWSTATIMMLISDRQRDDAARCRDLGLSAYLVKPIRRDDLLQAMLAVLGSRSQLEIGVEKTRRPAMIENRSLLNILLAEDNPVNQLFAVRLLEKRGYDFTVAATGREVLTAMEDHSFDLILMDVQMPDMDGYEATAEIRRSESVSGSHMPIIAMTAHAMKGDRERCLAHGMDDYISKPIQAKELFDMVEKYAKRAPQLTRE